MCNIIIINSGEREIETPREFMEHFGFLPDKDPHYNSIELDCCLCQCDIEETFNRKNIQFKKDCGDFYLDESDDDMLFHECPNCNWRCNCNEQSCSCCS